jgi:hypothetical protein
MLNYSPEKFTQCTFNYGVAVEDAANRGKGDYVYFWLGHDDRSNDIRLAKQLGKTVAVYTYMIAFDARKDWGLQDCNVGHPSLCEKGANYIRQNKQKLVNHYATEASKLSMEGPLIYCHSNSTLPFLKRKWPIFSAGTRLPST